MTKKLFELKEFDSKLACNQPKPGVTYQTAMDTLTSVGDKISALNKFIDAEIAKGKSRKRIT